MSTTIATDGACGANGAGGWAWVSEDGWRDSGFVPGTTNQRMELTAVLEALIAWEGRGIIIVTDSQYVIGCLTEWCHTWRERGWRNAKGKPVMNRDLIEPCLELLDHAELCHVKGHAGHALNELADHYAVAAKRAGA